MLHKIILYATKDTSDSGKEWGWVLGMLRNGIEPAIAYQKLKNTAEGRGKKNATKYSLYTIKKAMSEINKR